jgi:hypothetical protein
VNSNTCIITIRPTRAGFFEARLGDKLLRKSRQPAASHDTGPYLNGIALFGEPKRFHLSQIPTDSGQSRRPPSTLKLCDATVTNSSLRLPVSRHPAGHWRCQPRYGGDAKAVQDERLEHDPWIDRLGSLQGAIYPRAEGHGEEERISCDEILSQRLNIPAERQTDAITKRLAFAMRDLGWEGPDKIRFGHGRNSHPQRGYRRAVRP